MEKIEHIFIYFSKFKLGEEVGYKVRFDSACTRETRLLYCTDGVFLAEGIKDKNFAKYGVILLDEVHERALTTDVLLGLVQVEKNKKSKVFNAICNFLRILWNVGKIYVWL